MKITNRNVKLIMLCFYIFLVSPLIINYNSNTTNSKNFQIDNISDFNKISSSSSNINTIINVSDGDEFINYQKVILKTLIYDINDSDYVLVFSLNNSLYDMVWFSDDYFSYYNILDTINVGIYYLKIQIFQFNSSFNLTNDVPLFENTIRYKVIPLGFFPNLWNNISDGPFILSSIGIIGAIIGGKKLRKKSVSKVLNSIQNGVSPDFNSNLNSNLIETGILNKNRTKTISKFYKTSINLEKYDIDLIDDKEFDKNF